MISISNKKNIHHLFLILAVIFISASFFGIFGEDNNVRAGASDNIAGWAWSENIGWISLNCTNTNSCSVVDYGVSVNLTDGVLSGYAWSENIGWISFDESESSCPTAPSCKAVLDGDNFSGWVRALAGDDIRSGGWDGWISLSGANYGVILNSGGSGSFAWGSDVVGWVDFDSSFSSLSYACVSYAGDPCLSATNTCGQTNTGTISCDGSCDASPPPDSQCPSRGVTQCDDGIDNNYDGKVDIADDGCDNWWDESERIYQCNNKIDDDDDGKADFPADDGCYSLADDNESIGSGTAILNASPFQVLSGSETTLTWNISNEISNCKLIGTNGDSWNITTPEGTQQTGQITEITVFTLSCIDNEENPLEDTSITIRLRPKFEEI